jgi:FdhD protein
VLERVAHLGVGRSRGTTVSTIERPPVSNTNVEAWEGSSFGRRSDVLIVEEPLEIRLAGCSVAVTMRTPGNDLDLATGFLFTEGIIRDPADIASMAYCPTDDAGSEGNIVNVNPTDPSLVDPERWRRNFYATSSCGICGKASIESVRQQSTSIQSDTHVPYKTLYRLAGELRKAQTLFDRTGGLHAAAIFDLAGRLLMAREDIGRHNAVDKVIGAMLRKGEHEATLLRDSNGTPAGRILAVSSRGSFEIVQKALMAGIPIVATVSAPSSLAVDLAREAGMTLIGFLRSTENGTGRFNIYAGGERIDR